MQKKKVTEQKINKCLNGLRFKFKSLMVVNEKLNDLTLTFDDKIKLVLLQNIYVFNTTQFNIFYLKNVY